MFFDRLWSYVDTENYELAPHRGCPAWAMPWTMRRPDWPFCRRATGCRLPQSACVRLGTQDFVLQGMCQPSILETHFEIPLFTFLNSEKHFLPLEISLSQSFFRGLGIFFKNSHYYFCSKKSVQLKTPPCTLVMLLSPGVFSSWCWPYVTQRK